MTEFIRQRLRSFAARHPKLSRRGMHIAKVAIYIAVPLLGLVLFGDFIGERIFGSSQDYFLNVFTEAMGVGVTVFIIDRYYASRDRQRREKDRQRQERQETAELKRRLVRESRSRSNAKAIAAVEMLSDKGWLTGEHGLLKGAHLLGANLQNADLSWANLTGASLWSANLRDAHMYNAQLQGAELRCANIESANLGEANLQGANLEEANLKGASMWEANMENANLSEANLEQANMNDARLNGADLSFATVSSAQLTGANLQGTNLSLAKLENALLWCAELQGANLRHASLPDAIGFLDKSEYNDAPDKVATMPDGTRYTEDMCLDKFTSPANPDFEETLQRVNAIRVAMNLEPIPSPN